MPIPRPKPPELCDRPRSHERRGALDAACDTFFVGSPDDGWNLIQRVIARREIFYVAVIAGEYN